MTSRLMLQLQCHRIKLVSTSGDICHDFTAHKTFYTVMSANGMISNVT
jgi:hypothetical protein